MNRVKKILVLLAAMGAMCGMVAAFLPVFRKTFSVETPQTVNLPTETVYYAPFEPEETTEAITEPSPVPVETAAEGPEHLRICSC